ncbi:DUF2534 domain-containing protein, partial [Salmonella enterica subsp. enterica serovar Typhimurium]
MLSALISAVYFLCKYNVTFYRADIARLSWYCCYQVKKSSVKDNT